MAQVQIKQETLDKLAKLEVQALLDGLNDPEMMKNPAFLAKVRQFLKDNDVVITMETEGMDKLIQDVNNIPDLIGEEVFN